MTTRVALVALACTALAAGGCRSSEESATEPRPQSQAFAPRLQVEQRPSLPGRPTTLTINVTQQAGERALRSADIVVPSGFQIAPPAQGAVGTVAAALASPRGDAVVSGRLAHAPRDGTCAGGRALRAVLGPSPSLRIVLALRETSGSTRLTICPEKTDAALRRLTLRLDRGLTSPSVGDAMWRAIFTPADGEKTESRAVVPAPSFLTLETRSGTLVEPGRRFHVSGYLLQREPQPHRQVRILAGPALDRLEIVGRARTRANGSYRFTVTAPRDGGVLYVAARAASVEHACAPAEGCTTMTLSGVSSAPVRLTLTR